MERFESARLTWIEAQDGDYERPVFYAACKTDEGIAIVNCWENALPTERSAKGYALISTRWA